MAERLDWDHSVNQEIFDDLESVISTIAESSIIDSSDSDDEEKQYMGKYDDLDSLVSTVALSSIVDSSDSDYSEKEELDKQSYTRASNKSEKFIDRPNEDTTDKLNSDSNVQHNLNSIQNGLQNLTTLTTYSNISISNSTNIVLGNIIKINDDLTINVINNNEMQNKPVTKSSDLRIQPRKTWLIREPKEKFNYVEEPVNLVIISHTATSNNIDQSEYIEVIRDIQTFHIDTQGWNDIGYNFLITCDGSVYEGRGWGIEGAHCFGYNNRSMGISFIGRFKEVLPTPNALKACKELLRRGVDEGHLSKDYKLLGHCQCSTTESPGDKFFEEIKTWSHFYNKSIDDDLRD